MVSGSARAQIVSVWHNFASGQICLMRPSQREAVRYTPRSRCDGTTAVMRLFLSHHGLSLSAFRRQAWLGQGN